MLIKVDKKFQPFMNGLSEIEVQCEKVAEGMAKWLNLFPQLQVYLLDNQGEIALKSYFILDGEALVSEVDPRLPAGPLTCLELKGDIPTGNKDVISVLNILGGITMLVLSSIFPAMWGWGHVLGASMIADGVQGLTGNGGFSSSMIDLIEGFPEPVLADMSIDGSPTYTFDGVRNTTASGTPINVVYGQHRVGGHALNMYVASETKDSATSVTLHAQLGVCEGEVESLSAIEINKSPASFYNAVEFDTVHLGGPVQEVMPGFSQLENTTSVGRLIVQARDTAGKPVDFSASSNNSLFANVSTATLPVYGIMEKTSDGKWQAPTLKYCRVQKQWTAVQQGGV